MYWHGGFEMTYAILKILRDRMAKVDWVAMIRSIWLHTLCFFLHLPVLHSDLLRKK